MFIILLYITVEIVDIHLHLAEILMGKLAYFQINQHIAAQQAVVENQIDKKMIFIEGKAFLPGFEQKAFTQFQQKILQLIDNGGLKVALGILHFFLQTEKFQDIGVFKQIFGL